MSNLLNNRISVELADDVRTEVLEHIEAIRKLMPFLIGLTLEERKKLPKINKANKLFVEDAIEVNEIGQNLLPSFLKPEEMEKDYALFKKLDKIVTSLQELTEQVRDTQMLAGSEAYSFALMMYRMYRAAADSGVPGADTRYAKLKERFTQTSNSTSENEDIPTSDTTTEDTPTV